MRKANAIGKAGSAGRTTPLRGHLVLLVVGTLLPVVLFAVAIVNELSHGERGAAERSLVASAGNLAVAVDREVASTVRALQTLATSDRLERDDLRAFYAELKRAADVQPTWQTAILLTSDGRQILNSAQPFGAALPPVSEADSLHRTVETRAPAVGYLALGLRGGQWAFPVRVPVIHGSRVRYVLTAVITPEALARMIQNQVPAGGEWTGSVVDARGVIAARTQEPELFVGQGVRASLREAMALAREGVIRDTTRRGVEVYAAFSRAEFSDWTAVVSVPASIVEGPARRTLWLVIGAGLALLLLSGMAALALSRRISSGIASAGRAAEALARGERPAVNPSSIREIAALAEALQTSADLLARREQERNQHLMRAEAARADAEAANRLKDEFLSTVSHELRSPLQAILGWVKLISSGKLDKAKEQHAIGIIERNTKTQARLVDDLLDMSRIITGKLRLEQERVDLRTVVASAIEAIALSAEAKGITIAQELMRQPIPVLGDQNRLHQIVWNLLSNAIKFTPAGGRIEVLLRAAAGRAELTVRDSGAGIRPDFLPYVFERFRQADGSSSRGFGGLGVGLAIVRQLVELHGGTVRAESAGEGAGATFIVSLPSATAAGNDTDARRSETEVEPLQPAASDALQNLSGVRVLVLEDEVDTRDLIALALRNAGADVRACASAADGLRQAAAWKPDVIVSDIGMPEEDGYEFMRKLRASEVGSGVRSAGVALTAYAGAEYRVRALAAGYQAHLAKPVDPAELIATVARLAAGKTSVRGEPQGRYGEPETGA